MGALALAGAMTAPRMATAIACGVVALAIGLPGRLAAQDIPPQPEVRADLLGPSPYTLQLGGGVNLGAGYYQRVELDGGIGARQRGSGMVAAARVDALLRLLLDPFGQERWGFSMAGGVSLRDEAGDRVRPYLAGSAELEGPASHGVRVAYQLGLGGGVRLGVVIRRARPAWR